MILFLTRKKKEISKLPRQEGHMKVEIFER